MVTLKVIEKAESMELLMEYLSAELLVLYLVASLEIVSVNETVVLTAVAQVASKVAPLDVQLLAGETAGLLDDELAFLLVVEMETWQVEKMVEWKDTSTVELSAEWTADWWAVGMVEQLVASLVELQDEDQVDEWVACWAAKKVESWDALQAGQLDNEAVGDQVDWSASAEVALTAALLVRKKVVEWAFQMVELMVVVTVQQMG